MRQREEILELLAGRKSDNPPAFSGLIHVTAEGLQREGLIWQEVHQDARKLAKAAASTFKLSGLPSAVAPLDMFVEAQAFGAQIDFHENGELLFPQVSSPLFASTAHLTRESLANTDRLQKSRAVLTCEAIQQLKADVGREAVIGGMIPGPYTLLLFLVEPGRLFTEMKREPALVMEALLGLASFLADVGKAYRAAGADFITVHDMGGSPGFIGPARYEQFAYPAEKRLLAELPAPRVLSVCGNTNRSMHLLGQTNAEAISVDHLNDLRASRQILTKTLLFGNIDPVTTLWQGEQESIQNAVRAAREAGVDAVWPGCDLVLETSVDHLKAFGRA